MTPDIVRHIASCFLDVQGYQVRPSTRQLVVITADGKRHFFINEADFWKFTGDLTAETIKEK